MLKRQCISMSQITEKRTLYETELNDTIATNLGYKIE